MDRYIPPPLKGALRRVLCSVS